MECKFQVDTARQVIWATMSGVITRDGLMDGLMTINSDPFYKNTTNVIIDALAAEPSLSDWDAELVCFCLRSLGKMSEAVCYVINDDPKITGVVRMYQRHARHPIEVVSSAEEAIARLEKMRREFAAAQQ